MACRKMPEPLWLRSRISRRSFGTGNGSGFVVSLPPEVPLGEDWDVDVSGARRRGSGEGVGAAEEVEDGASIW